MKQLIKNSNIKYLIIFIIIVAGIVMGALKGFKFDLNYEAVQEIEITIGKEYNVNDIKSITNEIMPNKDILVEKVQIFGNVVSIKSKEITEEQKNNIVTKINEKYELKNKAEEINITSLPHTKFMDIYKKYMAPFIISLAMILVYVAIRFLKVGVIKSLAKTIFAVVISETVLMSIIMLARIPVGAITTALILLVYVISIVCVISKLENKLKDKKQKEEKE